MLLRPLIAAILLLASGGLGWIAYKAVSPASVAAQEVPPAATVKILVAGQPLQAGTLLKDVDVREREVMPDAVPEGSFTVTEDARAEIRGAMLRRYLDAGAPLTQADVLRPRDRGFLAAVLGPGRRAISIGVDAKSGASGLISPGDLVDVILTQELQRGDTLAGRRVVAETVLTLIRVIAVDQQIAQGAPQSGPNAGPNHVASTVTLQVTPEQANRVAVAERLGRLVLTVRPIDGEVESVAAIPARLNSVGRSSARQQAAKSSMASAQPALVSGASVYGADVSPALSADEPATISRMRVFQGSHVSDVTFR